MVWVGGLEGAPNKRTDCTDLSGPFFTVVTGAEFDSFSAWEADAQEIFGDPRFAAWFERMVPLVENGRREFYNVAG